LASALQSHELGEHVSAESLADSYGSGGAREVGEGYLEDGQRAHDPEMTAHGQLWLAVAFALNNVQL